MGCRRLGKSAIDRSAVFRGSTDGRTENGRRDRALIGVLDDLSHVSGLSVILGWALDDRVESVYSLIYSATGHQISGSFEHKIASRPEYLQLRIIDQHLDFDHPATAIGEGGDVFDDRGLEIPARDCNLCF